MNEDSILLDVNGPLPSILDWLDHNLLVNGLEMTCHLILLELETSRMSNLTIGILSTEASIGNVLAQMLVIGSSGSG